MKYLSLAVAIGMAVFTAVSIAFADTWSALVIVNLGPVSVSTFDVLFVAGAGVLVLANALRFGPEREPTNRLVLSLCWVYIGYQLFIVLPAAVLLHDLRAVDVIRLIEVRLALLLIPVTYSVVLRYWSPRVLIALIDAAAVGLLIWVIYTYVTEGPHGYTVNGVFRLRAVWGGGILLFGWLLLTSLFYWPTTVWRLALAGAALVGIGLANERSGLLACALSFVTVTLVVRGVARRALIALVLVVAVGIGVYYTSSEQVRQSVVYSVTTVVDPTSDQTAQDRVIRSTLGLDFFMDNPLGDYVWNKSFYNVNLGASNFVPHNFIVQLLVTQGAIASLLYFAIIGFSVFLAWRNRSDRLSSVLLAYLVFYFTFCLLNANVDLRENVSLFFITVALVLHQNRERALALQAARRGNAGEARGNEAAALAPPAAAHAPAGPRARRRLRPAHGRRSEA
jgi:hypothetical protein